MFHERRGCENMRIVFHSLFHCCVIKGKQKIYWISKSLVYNRFRGIQSDNFR